jgi:hypothetical protein
MPCPLRPELIAIDEEMQRDTPPHVLAIVAENYIRLIDYSKRLEARVECLTD